MFKRLCCSSCVGISWYLIFKEAKVTHRRLFRVLSFGKCLSLEVLQDSEYGCCFMQYLVLKIMSSKKDIQKYFTKFTEKHLRLTFLVINAWTWSLVISRQFLQIFIFVNFLKKTTQEF